MIDPPIANIWWDKHPYLSAIFGVLRQTPKKSNAIVHFLVNYYVINRNRYVADFYRQYNTQRHSRANTQPLASSYSDS